MSGVYASEEVYLPYVPHAGYRTSAKAYGDELYEELLSDAYNFGGDDACESQSVYAYSDPGLRRCDSFIESWEDEADLKALVARWNEMTAHLSSMTELVLNEAYQRIIGHGPRAIPFVLRQLRAAPDHWAWALRALTGANPVPPELSGDLDAERAYWLDWGVRNQYLEP